MSTIGSSPVLFKYVLILKETSKIYKGKTNLVAKCFIVDEVSTVRFCGFTLHIVFRSWIINWEGLILYMVCNIVQSLVIV